MPDGSMIHAREKDEIFRKWRENKQGIIFTSDNMKFKYELKGVKHYKIKKKNMSIFFARLKHFKKMWFAFAINNGYGKY
ncbi:MAG: hypothetical protein LBT62_06970 [Deltaproteobacteria bacterium]|jgi:phosphopantetheine adenylyltransferase|nr:hypothetical protein [Deltaproteobacteria bacterium]